MNNTEPKTFPIFSMINDFESKSFHIPELKAQHRSLYYFLLGVLLHRKGAKRFEIAYDYGMAGSKIGNHKTYTTTLKELESHGFLMYTPGKNRFTTPVIDMQFCKPTDNLLTTYCKSIGVSTANNIKTEETEETEEQIKKPKGYKAKASEDWFLNKFNSITGKSHRVLPDKVKTALKTRITKDKYTSGDFIAAITNCMNDSYHRENNLKHLTPEFITRADKLELYLAKATKPTRAPVGTAANPKTLDTLEAQAEYYGGGFNPNFKPTY